MMVGKPGTWQMCRVDQHTHIAIIDDDDSMRAALVGLVRSLGCQASGYASAEAFLGGPTRTQSHVVITDVQLPGLSGIDLADRLAAEASSVPVIMITARTDLGTGQRARASGALCVLRKPFAAEALIGCIERALAKDPPPG